VAVLLRGSRPRGQLLADAQAAAVAVAFGEREGSEELLLAVAVQREALASEEEEEDGVHSELGLAPRGGRQGLPSFALRLLIRWS